MSSLVKQNNDEENIENIKNNVISNKFDLGAYLDSNGETLVLVDSKGNVINEDLFSMLAATIVFKTTKNAKVIAPVTAPSVLEKIAAENDGQVVRTKTSSQAVMEEMLSSNILKSKENFLQFVLNFDAVGGLLKIVEFLAVHKVALNDLVDSIPKFNLIKKKIYCPWELKGTVMRTLIQEKTKTKMELLDGVKFIYEDGWALVLPDADKPLVRIFAEGDSIKTAEKYSEIFSKKIKEIVGI
jgi:mannose-1-phosphate guanylyltransferase/phosphomannomutase